VGAAQDVWYYYQGTLPPTGGPGGTVEYNQQFARWIARQGFFRTIRPFSRFQRLEFNAYLINLDQSTLNRVTTYDAGGFPVGARDSISPGTSVLYGIPSAALVYDNTLFGYTSIFYGQRYRFQLGQAVGGYQYLEAIADYRKYYSLGFPWTFAVRFTSIGRFGPHEELFPLFLGSPDRVRGYTYGSFLDNECSLTGSDQACAQLNRMVGSRMMVTSAEFRFPLIRGNALGFVPVGLPPVEGALWADAGVSWTSGTNLVWQQPTNPTSNNRAPITAYGASIRINMLGFAILNIDYAIPKQRPGRKGYWIVSLNPPF